MSNVDNRAWRNGLSSEPMYPHQEARNTTAAAAEPSPPSEMPDLGATDPADLEAKARAELGFLGSSSSLGKLHRTLSSVVLAIPSGTMSSG